MQPPPRGGPPHRGRGRERPEGSFRHIAKTNFVLNCLNFKGTVRCAGGEKPPDGDLLLHRSRGRLRVLVGVLHRPGELVVGGGLALAHGLVGAGVRGVGQAAALEELVVDDGLHPVRTGSLHHVMGGHRVVHVGAAALRMTLVRLAVVPLVVVAAGVVA